jgi:hypothetical protein
MSSGFFLKKKPPSTTVGEFTRIREMLSALSLQSVGAKKLDGFVLAAILRCP